jgi:hypothetical protein
VGNDELLFRLARIRLDSRLERGESLSAIEEELRGVPGLDEEWRSALWLYAWLLSSDSGAGAETAEPAQAVAPGRRTSTARASAVLGMVGKVVATAAAALVPPWPL